ncbi:alcohol dehydrogenase [Gordoniibacillus kamchatkensis]|uniref:Alcohol dehydrogenase n=1 Tax=Gordoniibacillus kamchatkensis TaxID=1590651 RepID=A0ABR5AM73_9BACL|nr:iron-containing alcohol dehydrogenase [Paenibacillus sp. VKM B-2647]KIL41635.1 alcohol dehydrogenase [Paenibacillus sp. VKM B-2647]
MAVSRHAFVPVCCFGPGAVNQLASEVGNFAPDSVLVVADPVLRRLGVLERLAAPLLETGVSVELFTDLEPEPSLELAERLVGHVRSTSCQLVIGVGGGSALDLAKLAAVIAGNEGGVADYLNLTGTRRPARKGLPKILIPTTSGTGSEVTNISVVSLNNTKDVVAHDYLLADIAIVDPELTMTLPPRVTAATGMDALTHAIEAYLSVQASAMSDGLALQAIRLIGRSLLRAVRDGNDLAARSGMSEASLLAGSAFFMAGVGGVHALAYPLGGQFHLPHGEANAVLLPYVIHHIRRAAPERLDAIVDALGGEFDKRQHPAFEPDPGLTCARRLHALVQTLQLPSRLTDFGIPDSALDALADDAVKQTRLLSRSPMPLARDNIRCIYEAAFRGIGLDGEP